MSSNLLRSAVWNIEGLSLDKIKDPHFINTISKFHMISFVETWTNDNDNEIKITCLCLHHKKNHLMYQLLVYFDRFMHYHGLYTCTYIQNMQNNKNTNMIE
jgi:hypothetical protein